MRENNVWQNSAKPFWNVFWPTALCVSIGLIVLYSAHDMTFDGAVIRTIFIGLAGLTVPHYLLLEICDIHP